MRPCQETFRPIFLVAALFYTSIIYAQNTCQGDCEKGFGVLTKKNSIIVGNFSIGPAPSFDYNRGPFLTYNKTNGTIRIARYNKNCPALDEEQYVREHCSELPYSSIEIGNGPNIAWGRGTFFHGYEVVGIGFMRENDPVAFLKHGPTTGIEFTDDFAYFPMKNSKCLTGDCKEAISTQYLIGPPAGGLPDSTKYLYVGHFNNGKWQGQGAFAELSTHTYFVGDFSEGKATKGAFFNLERGVAVFIENEEEVAKLNFVLPETPPNAVAASIPKNRVSFWEKVGGAILTVAVVGTELAAMSDEATKKAKREREAREQRERQNQPRQQQAAPTSQVSTCQYIVFYGNDGTTWHITQILKKKRDCSIPLTGMSAKTSDSFDELAYWRDDIIETNEISGKYKIDRNWGIAYGHPCICN